MKNSKMIIYWILVFTPFLLVVYFYNRLPEEIVTNWGFDGSMEYSPKGELWILAALSPVLAVMMYFMPKLDPKRKNYSRFEGAYDIFRIIMAIFIIVMLGITISEGLNPGAVNVGFVVCVFVGLLFTFMGNIMPKIKPNYFFGLRNPWTLASETVWYKAHRFAGKIMFVSGLVITAGSFFLKDEALFIFLFVILLIAIIPPSYMSYKWLMEEQGESGAKNA